jgi:hypothetical protein
MAWVLAICYLVTVVLLVAAAWVAGVAGICDTCQRQDSGGTDLVLVLAGSICAAISVGLTLVMARRSRRAP